MVVVMTADGAQNGKLSVCREVRRSNGYIAEAGVLMDKRQEGARLWTSQLCAVLCVQKKAFLHRWRKWWVAVKPLILNTVVGCTVVITVR